MHAIPVSVHRGRRALKSTVSPVCGLSHTARNMHHEWWLLKSGGNFLYLSELSLLTIQKWKIPSVSWKKVVLNFVCTWKNPPMMDMFYLQNKLDFLVVVINSSWCGLFWAKSGCRNFSGLGLLFSVQSVSNICSLGRKQVFRRNMTGRGWVVHINTLHL